ncbi:MAG TPA: glycine zipper domain-containing protein [Acidobacteriota bacterium]
MWTLNVRLKNFVSTLLLAMLVWFCGSAVAMAADWRKIGGSAAAGAVIGGVTRGKSGAVLGAIAGGAGGYVWDQATRDDRYRYEPRSKTESAEIIGASTVAGAAAGGVVGGKTGALIGAAAGAAGGYIYDRKTNNRDRGIFYRRY